MECQRVGFPPARVQNRSSHGGCCWHTAQVLPSHHHSPFPVSDVSDEGTIDDTSDKKEVCSRSFFWQTSEVNQGGGSDVTNMPQRLARDKRKTSLFVPLVIRNGKKSGWWCVGDQQPVQSSSGPTIPTGHTGVRQGDMLQSLYNAGLHNFYTL